MSSFKIFSARQYYIPRASRRLASRHKNSRIYWQCNILSHTAGIATATTTTTCPCIRDSNVHSCCTRKVAARARRPLPMDFCSTVAQRCGPDWLARLSPLRYRKMRSKPRNQEIGRLLPYTRTTTTPLLRQKEGRPSSSLSTVIVASLVISPSLFHISTRTHTTHTHVYVRFIQFL
uniref:Uncharacterized protein n=1 Tax=Trichogramma kaykai TaxID=54128 RepID=A0ABD2WR52_9HYME